MMLRARRHTPCCLSITLLRLAFFVLIAAARLICLRLLSLRHIRPCAFTARFFAALKRVAFAAPPSRLPSSLRDVICHLAH